jgi:hypothetical protein
MGSDEPGAACHKVGSHNVEAHGKGRSNELFTVILNQARLRASFFRDSDV